MKIKKLAKNVFSLENEKPEEVFVESDCVVKGIEMDVNGYPGDIRINFGGECWGTACGGFETEVLVCVGQKLKKGDTLCRTRGTFESHFGIIRGVAFSTAEKAELLLEIMKEWAGKPTFLFGGFGCFGPGDGSLFRFNYEEWRGEKRKQIFVWNDASYLEGYDCEHTLFVEIFGDTLYDQCEIFPFLKYKGKEGRWCRKYELDFGMLVRFVEEGSEVLKKEKEEKEKRNAESRLLFYQNEVVKALQGKEVSAWTFSALVDYKMRPEGGSLEGIKVMSGDFVVSKNEREMSNMDRGGIGRSSQVWVWFNGKRQMREWQYRDQYNANCDKPELYIDEIGEVVSDGDTVTIELKNHYGVRRATFNF